jgi:hypothetical protein
MDFLIVPLEGAGGIKFGMSPESARSQFSGHPRTFKRTSQDEVPCDYFENEGVFLYYDRNNELEAIEFVSPARPYLEGFSPLGKDFEVAKRELASVASQLQEEVDGAVAVDIGVSIYSPLAKEDPTSPVESALVFRNGYYEC